MTRGDWVGARTHVQQSRDPVLVVMYEWMLYRDNFSGMPFDRVAAFVRRHPQWPNQSDILATAERNMPITYPSQSVISWFQSYPPVTGTGLRRYVDALMQQGQRSEATQMLATYWPKVTSKLDVQAGIYSAYGSMIQMDTHRRRLDTLLFAGDNVRAMALASLLGRGYPQLADARIALTKGAKNAPTLVSRVPPNLSRDPGLMFERLKWRRKNKDDAGATAMLKDQPPSTMITNPEDWWKERNVLVRRLIEEKNFRAAYTLAAAHGQMEGQEYADAEWMCGWLALRFLNQPGKALQHFTDMYGRVSTSISRGRAAYWAGRAAAALGQTQDANKWYRLAAEHPKVYYGQLAALQLPQNERTYRPVTVTASQMDKNMMAQDELVRAIKLAHRAGLDSMRRRLINAKVETMKTPAEFKAFAETLSQMGLRFEAVRVAKKAAGQNIFLDVEAYPKLTQYFNGIQVDKALAHAVIRQESEFDQQARSPSGALGLMQLMPSTAAYVAKKKGWQHQTGWLTTRPEHNVLLGSAYLNSLLSTYGGSYPLVLGAYNAGGSRVNQWLRDNGDPRLGKVDWVDWIELIPIYETRNYVQRVMESYVVYNDYMNVK